MTDIIGKLIAIIIAFILIVIFPFTVITIDSDMKVRMRVENEVQRAIDEIIDSRQYSKSQIEDLNLSLAGLGPTFDVEVERYVRTIDPDPDQPGKTYISYIKSEDNSVYERGDKVIVHVKALGFTGQQRVLYTLVHYMLPTIDVQLAGRVR